MKTEAQILVLPKQSGMNAADRKLLRDAGIVVVEVNSPHETRLLVGERLPIDSNELLRAVMTAIANDFGKSYSEGLRLRIMDTVARAIVASNAAPSPAH